MPIYWIATLSVLIAIEAVLAGTSFFLIFPPQQSAAAQDFFATYQHAIIPKHDIFFLRLFIVLGVAGFVLLMHFFGRMEGRKAIFFKYFTSIDAAMVAAEIFFLFKYAVYHNSVFVNGFYISLILSAGAKIFSPELIKYLLAIDERLKDKTPLSHSSIWLTAGGMLLILATVWVPDVQGAVARMFFGEHFHHIDWLLISAGWVHISGNILGVDNISRYGLGAPIIISEIAQRLLGGFNYVTAVIVMMMVSVVYYWVWFYALRLVLKDTAWAFIAIFLGIRLQFFNMETFPFIFTYPQDTPVRFFVDAFFFLTLILHTQTGRMRWLYLSSALAGFYVFYVTGEGLYTLLTFYSVVLMREMYLIHVPDGPMRRLNIGQMVQLALLPWIVMVLCLWAAVGGSNVFKPSFWYDQFEFVRLYEAGTQAALMISNLTAPFVERASIAFIMPVIYMSILLILIGRLMQRVLKADGFIMACACIFLLISYHYHAGVSNNMPAYLRNGVVIAMVTVFIIKEATQGLKLYHQRLAKIACAMFVLICMVTTHQFLLHPNIFNLSRNPMTHPVVSEAPYGRAGYFSHLFISYPDAFKLPVNGLGEKNEMIVTENDFANDAQMKELYKKESDYSKDAALIQSLTSPTDKVPVVSSFENLILMQAKRRPFFYMYFFVNSQPRRMRKFPVTILFNKSNLMREINRIETMKPTYIFVEKTYFVSPIPQAYLYDNEDMIDLLSYIFSRYAPYKGGEFLEAMKRR